MKYIYIVFTLTLVSYTKGFAQDWLPLLEQVADDEESVEASQQVVDLLSELALQPINVNTASREQWQQLPFLSEGEIDGILEYVGRYGPVKSLGELAMVPQIDCLKRQLLTHFVVINKPVVDGNSFPRLANILRYGHHLLMATARIPFYERRGDQNGYLGYPYRHDLRYAFSYGQRLQAGVIGAQDAGEPFFSNRNKLGYDFYSFYVVLRDIKRLKALALGRYRLNVGMGLVLNNSFLLGKAWAIASMGANRNPIRQYSSRSQANYLQGAAATVNVSRKLQLTGFLSLRDVDATLNDDGSIATLVNSGYHRTQTEMDKKNNATQFAGGLNALFSAAHYSVGATAVYTAFNRDLQPDINTLYRRHNARGREFWNIGVNYALLLGPLSFHGETATTSRGAIATLNRLAWQVNANLNLTFLQRFYGMKYVALLANTLSDGGHVQNESALYLGFNWQPSRRFSAQAYADLAYHPWPRYQASLSSHSLDCFSKAAYTLNNNWQLVARYRLRRRQYDNNDKTHLIWKTEHRARLAAIWQTDALNLRTQLDFMQSTFRTKSRGWMLGEHAVWTLRRSTKLAGNIAWFHTDDYDSRIYVYERGVLYDFSMPAFYGEGIRYSLMVSHQFNKHLSLTGKLGVTDYFDRSTMGTGYQQVNGSSMTDLLLQLRLKL